MRRNNPPVLQSELAGAKHTWSGTRPALLQMSSAFYAAEDRRFTIPERSQEIAYTKRHVHEEREPAALVCGLESLDSAIQVHEA